MGRKRQRTRAILQPQAPVRTEAGPVVLVRFTKGWGYGDLLCSDPLIDGLLRKHGPDARIYLAGPAGNVAHHPGIAGVYPGGLTPDVTVDVRLFRTMSPEAYAELEAMPSLIGHMCSYGGVDPGDARPQLHLGSRERQVADCFANLDLRGPVVALCADTLDPLRHWPLERWRELSQWLHDQGCTVVNVGLKHSTDVGLELVGKLSLRDTAAVISRCDLFVGNNSGLFHYAQAAGTPCVALFSLATPSRFVHPGATVHAVQADLPCIDCMTRSFVPMQRTGCIAAPVGRCMLEITPEMVRETVASALAPARAASPAAVGAQGS